MKILKALSLISLAYSFSMSVSGEEYNFDNIKFELISKAAGLAYPIKNGIPILLEIEARKLNEDL